MFHIIFLDMMLFLMRLTEHKSALKHPLICTIAYVEYDCYYHTVLVLRKHVVVQNVLTKGGLFIAATLYWRISVAAPT